MKILSRNELKAVKGGDGSGWVTCVWTYTGNRTATVPCSYSAESCQADADEACLANDSCTNVDCN